MNTRSFEINDYFGSATFYISSFTPVITSFTLDYDLAIAFESVCNYLEKNPPEYWSVKFPLGQDYSVTSVLSPKSTTKNTFYFLWRICASLFEKILDAQEYSLSYNVPPGLHLEMLEQANKKFFDAMKRADKYLLKNRLPFPSKEKSEEKNEEKKDEKKIEENPKKLPHKKKVSFSSTNMFFPNGDSSTSSNTNHPLSPPQIKRITRALFSLSDLNSSSSNTNKTLSLNQAVSSGDNIASNSSVIFASSCLSSLNTASSSTEILASSSLSSVNTTTSSPTEIYASSSLSSFKTTSPTSRR